MNYLEDMKLVYETAFKRTIQRVKDNPIALFLPLIYGVIYTVAFYFLGLISPMFGILGGFIPPIITSLILSSYFSILSDLNFYHRISFKNFGNTFQSYFGSIYSVYCVLILASWILPSLTYYDEKSLLIHLVLFVAFNPIAEIIYIRGDYYFESFKSSIEFMKDNILLWSFPLLLYFIVSKLLGVTWTNIVLDNFIIEIPLGRHLYSFLPLSIGIRNLTVLILLIVTGFYTVFRGALFDILHRSTRRKRAYMGGRL
ncbi:MAG: hypothetical protein Q4P25_03765 [Tissierellia bacterium]|nr:hypothetical protein [Tissierellia bacterium]